MDPAFLWCFLSCSYALWYVPRVSRSPSSLLNTQKSVWLAKTSLEGLWRVCQQTATTSAAASSDVRRRTWRHGALTAGKHPVPGDDRQDPERRQRPGRRDEERRVARRSSSQIAQRVGDRPVSVDAQHEQVEYRRRAGRVVDRQPELTDRQAERPLDGEYVDGADRHDDKTDGEVRRCQAHDERVTHLCIQQTHMRDCTEATDYLELCAKKYEYWFRLL